MSFRLRWSLPAEQTYKQLQDAADLFKQVAKAIERIQDDPRHPSLNTHEFTGLPNPFDPRGKVFEAYAQNNTPGAYRIFWCYGPDKGEMTIIAITPHP